MILESREVSKVFLDKLGNGVGEKDENITEAGERWIVPSARESLDKHRFNSIWDADVTANENRKQA